jgi:multidrug resistance efflux pump
MKAWQLVRKAGVPFVLVTTVMAACSRGGPSTTVNANIQSEAKMLNHALVEEVSIDGTVSGAPTTGGLRVDMRGTGLSAGTNTTFVSATGTQGCALDTTFKEIDCDAMRPGEKFSITADFTRRYDDHGVMQVWFQDRVSATIFPATGDRFQVLPVDDGLGL